jgi:hypothetical protein
MGSRSSASAPPLHAGGSCSARCTQPDRGHRKLSSTVATAALHRLAAAFSVFAAGSRSSPSFVPERRAHLRATPNPSPKLTRYGSLPRTLGSHGGNACASQYASPRRLGLRTCPFTRKAPLGSTVQRTLRPGPSLALLGSGRFAGPFTCSQPGGAAHAPGAKTSSSLPALSFGAPGALHPSCKPNPSPKLTRYGKRCKPAPRHLVHHRVPGLQRLPPRAACLER